MPYAEQRFRHRQDGTCHKGAHPNWGRSVIGHSPITGKAYTMASDGCLVEGCAYFASRFLGRDITGGELCNYLLAHKGFTKDGLMKWDVFSAFMKGLLVLSTRLDKTYTERAVLIGKYVHWLPELYGGYVMDPLSGNIVVLKEMIASGKWQDTNLRRYLKALRKPAT